MDFLIKYLKSQYCFCMNEKIFYIILNPYRSTNFLLFQLKLYGSRNRLFIMMPIKTITKEIEINDLLYVWDTNKRGKKEAKLIASMKNIISWAGPVVKSQKLSLAKIISVKISENHKNFRFKPNEHVHKLYFIKVTVHHFKQIGGCLDGH